MNEVIADFIAHAVDTTVTATILWGMIAIFSVVSLLNIMVSDQEAISGNLKEYAIHNQYDNKHVYPQDIISSILKNRGLPAVSVKSKLGTHTWSTSTASTPYEVAELVLVIDQEVVYDANIIEGANGEVIGYEFVEHKNASCSVGR